MRQFYFLLRSKDKVDPMHKHPEIKAYNRRGGRTICNPTVGIRYGEELGLTLRALNPLGKEFPRSKRLGLLQSRSGCGYEKGNFFHQPGNETCQQPVSIYTIYTFLNQHKISFLPSLINTKANYVVIK